MAEIDLTKPGNTPRPHRMLNRRPQAYIALGFGVLDLLERAPIGVFFVLLGCYLLYRSRTEHLPVPKLGPVGTRRADEVMALAPTALPDCWTLEQYRAREVPVGDADQPAFPLVDRQGQVTEAITRADLDQLAPTDTADARLRDLLRRGRRRPMVLITRDLSLDALAGSVMRHDAIAVVVNADQHPPWRDHACRDCARERSCCVSCGAVRSARHAAANARSISRRFVRAQPRCLQRHGLRRPGAYSCRAQRHLFDYRFTTR